MDGGKVEGMTAIGGKKGTKKAPQEHCHQVMVCSLKLKLETSLAA